MSEWRKYNGAIIPISAPHLSVEINKKTIKKILAENKAYFARWTSDFDYAKKTDFWFIIKDRFEGLEELSSNTRKSIRKGLKNTDVQLVPKKVIVELGYEVYKEAFKRYLAKHSMKSKVQFVKEIESLEGQWDFWGVFNKQGKLIGYSQNRIVDGFCDYSTTKFHPDFLKLRISDVLFYSMTDYYLNEMKLKYVCGGTRSILHETNIQKEYIRKFKFRKAYCRLHVEYSLMLRFIVMFIYPLRFVFNRFNNKFAVKITALLLQEKIRRSFL